MAIIVLLEQQVSHVGFASRPVASGSTVGESRLPRGALQAPSAGLILLKNGFVFAMDGVVGGSVGQPGPEPYTAPV